MIRFILLSLFIWILWIFARKWYENSLEDQINQYNTKTKSTPPPSPTPKLGVMVRCDYCGLYLPEKEALSSDNTNYCCEAHKQAAQIKQ